MKLNKEQLKKLTSLLSTATDIKPERESGDNLSISILDYMVEEFEDYEIFGVVDLDVIFTKLTTLRIDHYERITKLITHLVIEHIHHF